MPNILINVFIKLLFSLIVDNKLEVLIQLTAYVNLSWKKKLYVLNIKSILYLLKYLGIYFKTVSLRILIKKFKISI